MSTILFIVLPFPSHYNSCLGLMQSFQRQGYRVVATTTPGLYDYIARLGIDAIQMEYIQEINVNTIKLWSALFLKVLLNPDFTRQRYREVINNIHSVRLAVKCTQPVEIYIDSTLSHYYYILRSYHSNIKLLNVRLSTRPSYGIPPYTSSLILKNTVLFNQLSNILWNVYMIKNILKRTVYRFAFFNYTTSYFINRYTEKHAINKYIKWEHRNVGYSIPKDVIEWVLSPIAFEYSWYKPSFNEKHIWYPSKVPNSALPDSLCSWLSLSNLNDKIIYCSLGTLSYGQHVKTATQFLVKLINVVNNLQSVRLIIAAGDLLDTLPTTHMEKIYLTDWVPQTELLPYCDLVVTHGGMNTVQECICANIPMLVYPLNKRVEQPGNAARIVYHKLGLKGSISYDSSRSIRRKLCKILHDPTYKENVRKMREYFMSSY